MIGCSAAIRLDVRPATPEEVRLLLLLDAGETTGLAPLDVRFLHTFAYFANILAPVWDLAPLDGKVLKRRPGPLYPELQHDLDGLVGLGLVIISDLGHVQDEDGHWRLQGAYRLHHLLADPCLSAIRRFDNERLVHSFLIELGLALSSVPRDRLWAAAQEDATYADPLTSVGNVIDFAEWQRQNWSTNAARRFAALLPEGIQATRGEQLHLYFRHLRSRLTS